MVQTISFLVGTYIDRRMYPEALAELDRIPDVPQGNADFKAIYYAYIELLTGGSGKNSDAAFILQQLSLKQKDTQQILAESMLASLYGNDYVRSIKGNKLNWYNNANAQKHFILIPNPANQQVTIKLKQPSLTSHEEIFLFDMTGRLVSTIPVNNSVTIQLDITNLYSGIYYLRLGTGVQVEKLVIIH